MIRRAYCNPIFFMHGRGVQCAIAIAVTALYLLSTNRTLRAEERRALHFDEFMMEATFRIEAKDNQGTVFIMGRPLAEQPDKSRYVLVTAAHVLEDMTGDYASLILRQRANTGEWKPRPTPLQIRSEGQPLWTKHPDADVAVMYIGRPPDTTVAALPMKLLATDEDLAKDEIRPGDELHCLGYPFGLESNPAGFPVLRSGKMASYPLLPTKDTKEFLFDFEVFAGNSGGPVYMVETGPRILGGAMVMGRNFAYIMGLVSQQRILTQRIREPYGNREQRYPVGLGVVIHASMIRETIERLPPP